MFARRRKLTGSVSVKSSKTQQFDRKISMPKDIHKEDVWGSVTKCAKDTTDDVLNTSVFRKMSSGFCQETCDNMHNFRANNIWQEEDTFHENSKNTTNKHHWTEFSQKIQNVRVQTLNGQDGLRDGLQW